MTDQTNAPASKKAYNLTVTPVSDIQVGENANGKPKITFKGELTLRGQKKVRTVVAQGVAAEKIDGKVVEGQPLAVRVLFDNVANDDGSEGGQFLTVIDLPRERPAKAA